MARIGFIGLGHMGLPMAVNLIKNGHSVTGYDLQVSAMHALTAAGGKTAANLKEAAQFQDVIITMLQTGEQVQSVWLKEQGLLVAAEPNTLFIDCSTIDVQSARLLHQEASRHHFRAVDAPVSGGVAGAAAATLTFMVGGEKESFAQAQKILSCMGKKIIHTGDAGSGQAAKICNNMILGISMIAVSEAFILAEHLGLSAKKLFEVATNASGECWAMSHYAPVPGVLENVPANLDYQPGFASTMMLKDLKLSQQSATMVGVNTPLGKHAAALYQQLNDKGMGELDFSAIIKLLSSSG